MSSRRGTLSNLHKTKKEIGKIKTTSKRNETFHLWWKVLYFERYTWKQQTRKPILFVLWDQRLGTLTSCLVEADLGLVLKSFLWPPEPKLSIHDKNNSPCNNLTYLQNNSMNQGYHLELLSTNRIIYNI